MEIRGQSSLAQPRALQQGVSAACPPSAPPITSPPTRPAPRADTVEVGTTLPSRALDAARAALAEAVGCNLLVTPSAMAATLAPTTLSGPAAAAAHESHVALLESLKGRGQPVIARHRLLFTWHGSPTSEKAVRILEKREVPRGEAGTAPLFLNADHEVGIPLASHSDLNVLDALEGNGSLDGVPDPQLAQALRDLAKNGQRFLATFHTQAFQVDKKKKDAYDNSDERVVGPYGAYKLLSGGLPGVSGLRCEGNESFPVENRETLLAHNYFVNQGSSTGLADREQAEAMRQLGMRFKFPHGATPDQMAVLYVNSLEQPAEARTFRINPGTGFFVTVNRDELLEATRPGSRLDDLKARHDRMARLDADHASCVLHKMVDAGHVDDDHEQAFGAIAGLAGDGSSTANLYDAVMGALAPGESAAQGAAVLVDLCRDQFPNARGLAAATFVALRTESDKLQGPLGDQEKAQRFVDLVHYTGDARTAVGAWASTGAGTLPQQEFETHLGLVRTLEGTGRQAPQAALERWAQVRSATQEGDDLAEAARVMQDVFPCVGDFWGAREAVGEAFRFAWQEVPKQGPADMPVADRRQHYMRLLREFRAPQAAAKGWELLRTAGTTQDLAESEDILLRINKAAPRDAFRAFSELADATRDRGGFNGPEAVRWLNLIEACGSWDAALQADRSLQVLPAEVSADDRVAIYCDLARGNDRNPDRVAEDLGFLGRYVAQPSALPSSAARYANLLCATGGRTGEARESLALLDAHLSQAGPSGLEASHRQELHVRLLSCGLDCGSAHVLLSRLERPPADPSTATTGVDAFERIRSSFKGESTNALDATRDTWKTLESRSGDPTQLARTASAVADVLPLVTAYSSSRRWFTEKVLTLQSLDAVREACEDMGRIATVNQGLVTSYTLLRPFAERQGWAAVLAAVKDYQGSPTVLPDLLEALHENPGLAQDGAATMLRRLGCLSVSLKADATLRVYDLVHTWAQGVSWAGDTSARMDRWCEGLSGKSDLKNLATALEGLSAPYGRETLEQRETAFLEICRALPNAGDPLSSAACLLRVALEDTVAPDDFLPNTRGLISLRLLDLNDTDATRVFARLQQDRASGGRFADQSLGALVEEFGAIYRDVSTQWDERKNVSRVFGGRGQQRAAAGNPLDEALELMHDAVVRVSEVVQHDEGEVVIGGVRLKMNT